MENKGLLIGIAAVAIIGIAAFAFTARGGNQTASQQAGAQPTTVQQAGGSEQTAPTTGAMEGSTAMEAGSYKDGEYEASGTYTSPAGQETVDVSLTLKSGVVETIEFTGNATNEKSVFMQGMFKDNFMPLVVGKNIDEVKLDKVSGSSLTSGGFNDAINKIKEEAKS